MLRMGIVIPYYATKPHHSTLLVNCIRSLRKHGETYERVIVLDDASPIPPPRELIIKNPFVTYWRKEKNSGYSDTVNKAADYFFSRDYDWMLTLNQDVEILRPFTPTMREIHANKLAQVVGAALIYPNGKLQSAGFYVRDEGPEVIEPEKYAPFLTNAQDAHQAKYVMGVTGAMQFIHRSCTRYSSQYGMGYEDVEFCVRQWSEGRKVLYAPAIEGLHCEGAIRGKFPSPRELASVAQWEEDVKKYDIEKIRERVAAANSLVFDGKR